MELLREDLNFWFQRTRTSSQPHRSLADLIWLFYPIEMENTALIYSQESNKNNTIERENAGTGLSFERFL